MDESWRISIGSIVPRRRSTEEPRRRHRPEPPPGAPALGPEDFRDVFGGPPRSVLLRRFSGDLTSAFASSDHRPASSTSFYDEVFRPAGAADRGARGMPPAGAGAGAGAGEGRRLPAFRIPAPERRVLVRTEVGFYNDIFRSDGGGRSRSRSKSARSKSSSAISLDDVSPPVRASATAEDAVLSSFASKLRPITIPSRRRTSSPPSTISVEEEHSHRTFGINWYPPQKQQHSGGRFMDSKNSKGGGGSSSSDQTSSEVLQQRSHAGGGFSCCFLLPETTSLEASFRRNRKEPVISFCNSDDDDGEDTSPSSVISSAFHDPSSSKADADADADAGKVAMEIEREATDEEEGDQEIASSYVIKIGNVRERAAGEEDGAAGVDEAIAWAKEKFWSHQMAKVDLDEQIHDEEMFYSIEDNRDGFRGHGNMVCIQFGED